VELNEETDEIFVAYVMVVGADPRRFGRMIERLENAYSFGTNNYPLTITDAKLYLERTEDSNHTSSEKYTSTQSRMKNTSTQSTAKRTASDGNNSVIHSRGENTDEETVNLSFSQSQTCDVCGKNGHSARRCYYRKKIPKDQWHSNQEPPSKEQETCPKDTNLVQTTAWYDV
jgi:hypothetical protein